MLLLQLIACSDDKGDQGATAGRTASDAPPALASNISGVSVDEANKVGIAGPAAIEGTTNYNRNGSMLIGGPDISSATYEVGGLRAGDRLKYLWLMLGEGREAASGCRVSYALAGAEQWQTVELKPADHLQQVGISGSGLVANSDTSLFIRVATDQGLGIALQELRAEFELSSTQAVGIEIDIPAMEAHNVDIRVPLRALDADGRQAESYVGQADLILTLDDLPMHIPLGFVKGYAEAIFRLSEAGDYLVDFTCELQEPHSSVLHVYKSLLPVYSLEIQQVQPGPLDTTDLGDLPAQATFRIDDSAPLSVTVSGQHLMRDESRKRPLLLDIDGGYEDPEYGYLRTSMELRAAEFDPTQLRDLLATWVYQASAVPVLRLRPVHLRLNGCYQGVFIEAELPDQAWLDAAGMADDAELYVMSGVGGLNPKENLAYFDDLFRRVRQPDAGMQDLQSMLNDVASVFASVKDKDRLETLSPYIDNIALYNYLAAQSMTSATDNWRRNYAVSYYGQEAGLWSMLPLGMDLSFGITEGSNPVASENEFELLNEIDMVGGIDDNIILRTLMSNGDSQRMFRDRLYGLMDSTCSEENMLARLEQFRAMLALDIKADPFALVPYEEYGPQLELISTNIRAHWSYLRAQVVVEGAVDSLAGH